MDTLGLGDNQITDLAPLSALTSLTGLGLDGNQITDLAPRKSLTKLRALYLDNNPGSKKWKREGMFGDKT
eukprot:SAG22_NODE_11995_length_460_cov_1.168975_1_plen_69_part_01